MLRLAESFNTHLGASEMTRRYGSASGSTGLTTSDQVLATKGSFGLVSGGLVLISKALVGSATNTWVTGARFKMQGALGASATFTAGGSLRNSAGDQVYWRPVRVDSYSYKIEVRRGSTDTLLGTSSRNFFYDKWVYVELEAVVRTSTNGSFTLWVDDVNVATAAGVNTAGQGTDGADRARLSWVGSSAPQVAFADWVVTDDVAGEVGPLGSAVFCLGGTASADGPTTDWTRNAGGSNFGRVNEGPALTNDATYVFSETTGDIDVYSYDSANFAIIGTGAVIHAVNLTSTAAMQASGVGSVDMFYDDGMAGTAQGTDTKSFSNTSQIGVDQIMEENGVTMAPFTKADIENGNFGLKRVP